MKKYLALALVFGMVAMSYAETFAIELNKGVYVSAKFGVGDTQTKMIIDARSIGGDRERDSEHGTARGGAFAMGYRFSPMFRAEVEGGMYDVKANVDSATMTMFSARGYLDVPIDNVPVVPYLSAGIGTLSFRIKDTDVLGDVDWKSSGPSFDAGVGLSYAVVKNFALDASFRYMYAPLKEKNDSGVKLKVNVRSAMFFVGGRYIF